MNYIAVQFHRTTRNCYATSSWQKCEVWSSNLRFFGVPITCTKSVLSISMIKKMAAVRVAFADFWHTRPEEPLLSLGGEFVLLSETFAGLDASYVWYVDARVGKFNLERLSRLPKNRRWMHCNSSLWIRTSISCCWPLQMHRSLLHEHVKIKSKNRDYVLPSCNWAFVFGSIKKWWARWCRIVLFVPSFGSEGKTNFSTLPFISVWDP